MIVQKLLLVSSHKTIIPTRLNLVSRSLSKSYDGTSDFDDNGVDINIGSLDPEDSISFNMTANNPTLIGESVDNTFTYTITPPESARKYDITIDLGTLDVTDEDVDPNVILTMQDVRSYTGEDAYSLGEDITIDVTVINPYADQQTITLTAIEGLELDDSTFEDVPPGLAEFTQAKHRVTEEDILQEDYTGTITISVGNITVSNECTIYPEPCNESLEITVTASEPANDEYYQKNEQVTITINITNNGNLTLTDVEQNSKVNNNNGTNHTIATIKPRESKQFTDLNINNDGSYPENNTIETTVTAIEPANNSEIKFTATPLNIVFPKSTRVFNLSDGGVSIESTNQEKLNLSSGWNPIDYYRYSVPALLYNGIENSYTFTISGGNKIVISVYGDLCDPEDSNNSLEHFDIWSDQSTAIHKEDYGFYSTLTEIDNAPNQEVSFSGFTYYGGEGFSDFMSSVEPSKSNWDSDYIYEKYGTFTMKLKKLDTNQYKFSIIWNAGTN